MSIPTEMQALVVTKDDGSTKLVSKTVAVPKIDTSKQVLIKIAASFINPSDLMNTLGGFPNTTFPRIPGRDYAGNVVAGPDDLLGKKVFGSSGNTISFTQDGTHAEYVAIEVDAIVEMPSNIDFIQAASIGTPFSTAFLALDRAFAKSSDMVLVLGASGTVGDAVMQIAKARGCKVLTAARHDTFDVNLKADPNLAKVKDLTSGKGPDLIIDTVGDPTLMRAGLEVLGLGGRYSYISAPKSGSTELTYDMKNLYRLNQTIVGNNSLNYTAKEIADILKKLMPEFESGALKLDTSALTSVKLGDEALEAYGKMKAKQPGKFMITV